MPPADSPVATGGSAEVVTDEHAAGPAVASASAGRSEPPPGSAGANAGAGAGAGARQVLVASSIVAAFVVGLLFLWYARDVLLLVFAGVLVSVFLRRLATLVSDRTPLPSSVSLAIVVLTLASVLFGVVWLRGGAIVAESQQLREELPKAVTLLRDRIADFDLGAQLIDQLPDDPVALLPDGQEAITQVTGAVSRTFGVLASGVIILFLGIVFAATPDVYRSGVLALFPARRVQRIREVLDTVGDTLWWWLIGRIISMTFIGVITGVGLALLGVPLAFILALLAALLSFIPNLGPILSALPAILLALVQGPQTALWVAALYAGIQVVESYLLAPLIDRKTVSLPPAYTISAQLLMALFAGLLGLTLATPLAAVVVVLVTMLYVQDGLGRRDIRVASH